LDGLKVLKNKEIERILESKEKEATGRSSTH
jgi:hypothetical protein